MKRHCAVSVPNLPSEATTVRMTANIAPCGPPRRVEKFANLMLQNRINENATALNPEARYCSER